MARQIDPKFEEITTKYTKDGESPIKLFKRFLDDMFIVYTGSVPTLHMFFEEINQIHPKLKFTMTHSTPGDGTPHHECSCEQTMSIPFLDTLCTIKEGKIETDLYRKPTDKNQYLLTSSCHPVETVANIPHSMAYELTKFVVNNKPERQDFKN